MRLHSCLIILASFSFASFPAAADEDAIDAHFTKCLGSDSTTTHMVDCAYKNYDEWDKSLNENYALLMSNLLPDEGKTLQESQRQWLAFRDHEFKLIDATYAHVSGTMYIPMRINDRAGIVKVRALQLNGYASLIDDGFEK